MKVDLVNDYDPRGWRAPGRPAPIIVYRSLPFVTSTRGNRSHRARSARVYPHPSGLCVTAWCGPSFHIGAGRAVLTADPYDGYPVCATCEGRAVGAGQVTSGTLTGTPVVFTPRPAGERVACDWERRPYGPYGYGGACWSAARFVATDGTDTLRVCRTHYRCAVTRGWDVEPLPGTVTRLPSRS